MLHLLHGLLSIPGYFGFVSSLLLSLMMTLVFVLKRWTIKTFLARVREDTVLLVKRKNGNVKLETGESKNVRMEMRIVKIENREWENVRMETQNVKLET